MHTQVESEAATEEQQRDALPSTPLNVSNISATPGIYSALSSTSCASPSVASESLLESRCRTHITPEMLRPYPEASPSRKKLGGRLKGNREYPQIPHKNSVTNITRQVVKQTKQKNNKNVKRKEFKSDGENEESFELTSSGES